MEVHHHAHHGHGKKSWKSYIWEFVMLFMAVFCGFMAEWQFEHMVENTREKTYIKSIIEDINTDVAQAKDLSKYVTNEIVQVDSLLDNIKTGVIVNDSKESFRLWKASYGFPDFIPNDRTIQQLKNGGGLRLIRKKGASDKIMEYDQMVRTTVLGQNVYNNLVIQEEQVNAMFDFIKLYNNPNDEKVPLTTKGKTMLNEVYGSRSSWKHALKGLQRRFDKIATKGAEIAEVIKKEYGLN